MTPKRSGVSHLVFLASGLEGLKQLIDVYIVHLERRQFEVGVLGGDDDIERLAHCFFDGRDQLLRGAARKIEAEHRELGRFGRALTGRCPGCESSCRVRLSLAEGGCQRKGNEKDGQEKSRFHGLVLFNQFFIQTDDGQGKILRRKIIILLGRWPPCNLANSNGRRIKNFRIAGASGESSRCDDLRPVQGRNELAKAHVAGDSLRRYYAALVSAAR